jgi:hypothetical protein
MTRNFKNIDFRIHLVEEVEMKTKGTGNVFSETIDKNFPNQRKMWTCKVRRNLESQMQMDQE